MATLWEMMIFSESSNSWKTSGLRTFVGSEKVSESYLGVMETCTYVHGRL
jgi:hypothetical protein